MIAVHDKEQDNRSLRSNYNSRNGGDTFCTTPVSKGEVKFPDSLAGRGKIDFDMYSGYVPVSTAPDYLFYWFFGTQDKSADAPLLIWTNGGPGCTAMEGATTEHGPLSLFDIKESCSNAGPTSKCDYTGQLSANAFAWNKHANVVYLDQPKNVGFSFGYGSETKTSVEAADDFVTFYLNWVKLFPEFQGRQLLIGGESYGGHYIPAWANAVLNYNAKTTDAPIPLSGVVIGNGCINDTVQDTSQLVQFQHDNNLIPSTSNPKSQSAARTAMSSYIGYDPNYYDYRIQTVTCSACYSYNYTAWSYWFLQQEVLTSLNVCGGAGNDAFAGSAGGCISMGAFDARDSFDYSGALARTLDSGIPVTLFYGKTDTACNYVGGLTVANTLQWKGKDSFAKMPLVDWELGAGNVAGQYKSFNGLTFIQVRQTFLF
jgi:carboxypeptidase C (cathepsin A)